MARPGYEGCPVRGDECPVLPLAALVNPPRPGFWVRTPPIWASWGGGEPRVAGAEHACGAAGPQVLPAAGHWAANENGRGSREAWTRRMRADIGGLCSVASAENLVSENYGVIGRFGSQFRHATD